MALIAEYGFNEGTGTTVSDSSGNGFDMTFGTYASWVAGHTAGGAAGPGSGNSANGSAASLLGGSPPATLTVMLWVHPTSLAGPIFSGYNTSGDQAPFVLGFESSGMVEAYVSDGAGVEMAYPASTPGLVSTGNWYHVACVLDPDGDVVTVYLNGVQVAQDTWTGTIPYWYITLVGSSRWGAFNGVVDDLRMFDTALTQSEIAGWMDTPVGESGESSGAITNKFRHGSVTPGALYHNGQPVNKMYYGPTLVVGEEDII